MGVLNMRLVETAPGANADCPFSPPAEWKGNDAEYRELIRLRYETDLQASQRKSAQARFCKRAEVDFRGPFASTAKEIIQYLSR